MSNYRPDPITIKDGVETIPLAGGEVIRDPVTLIAFSTSGLIHMARTTHATLTTQADEIERLRAENAELKAQTVRDDEHYKAAMGMSEKHRRNWVEACQQNTELREKADRYLSVLEDLVSWFPATPSHEWRIKAGEIGADDAIKHARETIDAAMAAKEST